MAHSAISSTRVPRKKRSLKWFFPSGHFGAPSSEMRLSRKLLEETRRILSPPPNTNQRDDPPLTRAAGALTLFAPRHLRMLLGMRSCFVCLFGCAGLFLCCCVSDDTNATQRHTISSFVLTWFAVLSLKQKDARICAG